MIQDAMAIIRMIPPAAAPPAIAAKLLSEDPGGGGVPVLVGEGFELLVILEAALDVVITCCIQSAPVYPSLQIHSPG